MRVGRALLAALAVSAVSQSGCVTSESCSCGEFDPVCGKNGKEYRNECELDCFGVEMAYRGPCVAGEPCSSGCINGECVSQLGRCYKPCNWDFDWETFCADGQWCMPAVNGDNYCFDDCQLRGRCPEGHVCRTIESGIGVCQPICDSKADCAPGEHCDSSQGVCVLDMGSPDLPERCDLADNDGDGTIDNGCQPFPEGTVVSDLGRYLVTEQANDATFTFDAPDDVRGIFVVVYNRTNWAPFLVRDVWDPSGELVVESRRVADSSVFIGGGERGIHVGQLIHSPDYFPPSGRWTFSLQWRNDGYYDPFNTVQVIQPVVVVRTAPIPLTGVFDLNVMICDVPGWDAATAHSDPVSQLMISQLRSVLHDAHLDLDQVAFVNVPPERRQYCEAWLPSLPPINPEAEIYDAAELSDLGTIPQAASLVLVRDIPRVFADALGASPRPGIPFVTGTAASAAIVGDLDAWNEIQTMRDANDAGLAEYLLQFISAPAAHELMHYFGLSHVGDDLLADTLDCATEADCADNLMFPFAAGGQSLTPQQRDLAFLHPMIRPAPCADDDSLINPVACGPSCMDCTTLPGIDPSTAACVDGVCAFDCASGFVDSDGVWITGCES